MNHIFQNLYTPTNLSSIEMQNTASRNRQNK